MKLVGLMERSIGNLLAAPGREQKPLSGFKIWVPVEDHILEHKIGICCFQSWPETLVVVGR
jgi:hypothetical protein